MASVKSYRLGDASAPVFPAQFDVVKKSVLQVTDIKTNRNKYYAIELHQSGAQFRVFTHYGRTDDLETNPDAGAKECRFFAAGDEAHACYQQIFAEKTSVKKGYKEVSLASSKIGSSQARGTSSGSIDGKTIAKIATPNGTQTGATTLPPLVESLVQYIYDEATVALTSTVAAKITANGIETPLGVLSLVQIERGEQSLRALYDLWKTGNADAAEIERMSGEFYTYIPHRIGRTRTAVQAAVIDNAPAFAQKQETLQLMKDMLSVSGDGGVLFDSTAGSQYAALKCQIQALDPLAASFRELEQFILASQVKSKKIQVKNIYTLKRSDEWTAYDGKVGNERQLFHGSRITNWVGLLSRGILMPKWVVNAGGTRTDAGWLGNGIYFGDAACTGSGYTTAGKRGTRVMALCRVALGRTKDYTKITYGLDAPPQGFDSCHGVRNRMLTRSEFADDEFVVYETKRQRLEALVEFSA